jgi:transcriptional antiterminator NusG
MANDAEIAVECYEAGSYLSSSISDLNGSMGNWYGIYTKSRHEKLVASKLQARGFDVFLPLYQVKRRLSLRRQQVVLLPLFPGYVFVRFVCNARNYHSIRASDGVVSVIGGGYGPTPIPESQIEMVRRLICSEVGCRPTANLRRGEPVVVIAGPLAGSRGTFVRQKGKSGLVLTLSLLHRSVLVEIDPGLLRTQGPYRNL